MQGGKIRNQGGKAGPFKGHMFLWPKDSGDPWLCLLSCLEGICDSQAFFWRSRKALKQTFIFLILKK